ncbi:MAG: hypothetical protein KKF78_11735 [Candidatus Omnitrophica bacterium]|nr:hypothetical protein [Candidatus Omnitrophota bacterium]MBU1997808.1 hypothetical protein [Candidatus Omnitrophota bacterium]
MFVSRTLCGQVVNRDGVVSSRMDDLLYLDSHVKDKYYHGKREAFREYGDKNGVNQE